MAYGPEDIQAVRYIIQDVAEGVPLYQAATGRGITVAKFYSVLSGLRELGVDYARAREIRADVDVDEAVRIADDPDIDPQRAKNMIDIRKWRASKHHSKVYGDRVDLNIQQSISISDALSQARGRLLPMSDQPMLDVELIPDNPTLESVEPTDGLSGPDPEPAGPGSIFD